MWICRCLNLNGLEYESIRIIQNKWRHWALELSQAWMCQNCSKYESVSIRGVLKLKHEAQDFCKFKSVAKLWYWYDILVAIPVFWHFQIWFSYDTFKTGSVLTLSYFEKFRHFQCLTIFWFWHFRSLTLSGWNQILWILTHPDSDTPGFWHLHLSCSNGCSYIYELPWVNKMY